MQTIINIELLVLLEQLDKGNMITHDQITSSLCSFLSLFIDLREKISNNI